ncbi:MAG: hypothetical protein ACFFD3_12885 [Candidatus Thorarchaeota archaeon]
MVDSIIPGRMVGHFLGVGSLVEDMRNEALEYITRLELPYAYQTPSKHEEDMIRQFGSLLHSFEDKGTFIYEINHDDFSEMIDNDTPLLPDERHFHSLYSIIEKGPFNCLKTQVTAPATMGYSIRDSKGNQYLTPQMFHFFLALAKRISTGYMQHFAGVVKNLFICLDDPALGFVVDLIETGKAPGLTPTHVMSATDNIIPKAVTPIYHYCYDWRTLNSNGRHLLWESRPKILHLDMISYPPRIDNEQAELANKFLATGGGIALGILPNTDSAYSDSVKDTIEINGEKTLSLLQSSGVDMELLEGQFMVSTQCGLSGASSQLSKQIHENDSIFTEIMIKEFRKFH